MLTIGERMSNNPNENLNLPNEEHNKQPDALQYENVNPSTQIAGQPEQITDTEDQRIVHRDSNLADGYEPKPLTEPVQSAPTVRTVRKKKKKRKRRLRKPIRYALLAICAGLCAWLLYFLLFQVTGSHLKSGNNSVISSTPNQKEESYTVLIDAGHGGFDGGNVSEDGLYLEKDINLQIALKVKAAMAEINPKANVLLTRDDDNVEWAFDEISDLIGRTTQQKESNADFFVSLHCNAFLGDSTVQGYTLFINSYDPFMKAFANNLNDDFTEVGWSKLDSITEDYLFQLVSLAPIPSILVELGYMTNPSDMAGLVDENMQNQIAYAIAKAINDTYTENESLLEQSKTVYKGMQAEKDKTIAENAPGYMQDAIHGDNSAIQNETNPAQAEHNDQTPQDPNAEQNSEQNTENQDQNAENHDLSAQSSENPEDPQSSNPEDPNSAEQ
ncbi:N-acetylmuramoyl-L-alanine amidase family protein [Ileibacterium valens]|uniref:N-acetylmuramoyl-L-alanine amidase family protein n=1 Tax=Ileibacterium valens TaxID=1862668 RepID=UPI00259B140D|nr:N-acetylmuramoyl-L-alanine amidase [Ileibacterium valens]